MTGVLVVGITKSNILATIDVTSYISLKDLYEDLLALKKDTFADDERIVIVYNSNKQKQLIDELLLTVDIPDFFITFELSDNKNGIDFNFSDSFCIYPWINLRISTVGDISPCCLFKETIANLDQTTIKEVYQGKFMRDLRRSFLVGEKPTQCSVCWNDEAINKPSMRQRAKHKFREIYYQIDYQQEDFNQLQLFDLNLGNTCNLSCRICHRQSSSSIADQDYADGRISAEELKNLSQSVRWAESDHFWDQMLGVVQNIKYLDLYGGEPLMSKAHFKFLRKLIDLDMAKNIKIDYNSNGTVYSEHFFDLWRHFKEVKISFSIDDIGDRFESQRVGAKWNIVCKNILKYNSRKSEKFITEIFPTINTQNVLYLPELLAWIDTQEFDHVAFNILHEPKEYNITFLDIDSKKIIIEKLKYNSNSICASIITLLENSMHIAKTPRQIKIIKV